MNFDIDRINPKIYSNYYFKIKIRGNNYKDDNFNFKKLTRILIKILIKISKKI